LTELSLGESAQVVEILAEDKQRRRLLDLGLTEGTRVVAKRKSPSGAPKAFLIRGTLLALRSAETDLVVVKSIEN
jgi:ferrous iron transport protein A